MYTTAPTVYLSNEGEQGWRRYFEPLSSNYFKDSGHRVLYNTVLFTVSFYSEKDQMLEYKKLLNGSGSYIFILAFHTILFYSTLLVWMELKMFRDLVMECHFSFFKCQLIFWHVFMRYQSNVIITDSDLFISVKLTLLLFFVSFCSLICWKKIINRNWLLVMIDDLWSKLFSSLTISK